MNSDSASKTGETKMCDSLKPNATIKGMTRACDLDARFAKTICAYLTLDAAAAQSCKAVGYVSGVGYSGGKNARVNYTRDPCYTDGNRAVLILSDERRAADQIQLLQWENPQ